MKLLKNPIFWVVVLVVVVIAVGYKVMVATFMQQQALKMKEGERVLTLKNYNLYGIAMVPPSTLWIAGSGGIALYSTDRGDTWEEKQLGAPEQVFSSIAFPDKDHGWMVGTRGTILGTQDGGATWSRVEREGGQFLMKVFFLNPTLGWIVGESGTLLLTVDGGATWESIETDKYFNSLTDIMFLDENRGWAVGERGLVMATTDGGRTWQDQQSGTEKSLMTITASVDGEHITLWAGGLEGTVIASYDQGLTWEAKVLKAGEEKLGNHVYKLYDKLSGTKGLGHHHVYALCRNIQTYTFDGGVGWRLFMMPRETSDLLSRAWLHDMLFYRSEEDALSQDAGWAAEVSAQGESSLGWLVGRWGIVLRTTDSQNWVRIH